MPARSIQASWSFTSQTTAFRLLERLGPAARLRVRSAMLNGQTMQNRAFALPIVAPAEATTAGAKPTAGASRSR